MNPQKGLWHISNRDGLENRETGEENHVTNRHRGSHARRSRYRLIALSATQVGGSGSIWIGSICPYIPTNSKKGVEIRMCNAIYAITINGNDVEEAMKAYNSK